jgi:hypothetical protein
MSVTLKAGDRVRVIAEDHESGNLPGDKGTIYRVDVIRRVVCFHVAMDKDGETGTTAIFADDEIEPDV